MAGFSKPINMEDLKIKFLEKVKEYGCKNEVLAGNFFTAIDAAIKKSEADRAGNQYKANDPKIRWVATNFDETLQSAIAYANLGIDPLAEDMISFVFHKSKTGGYNVTFIEGVSCMEILARRYGVNCPDNIKVELVYSTDIFEVIKKDISNPEDTCTHKIVNAFDRGDIVGGYSLSQFPNSSYNQIRPMSLKDIHKRTKENSIFMKNWPDEMCIKTLKKNAWSKVVLNTVDLAEYFAAKSDPVFEPEDKSKDLFNPDEVI